MKLNYAIIKYSPKTTPSAILERVQNRNDNTFGRLNWNKSAAQYEKEKIVIYFERNAGTTTYEDINKCKDEIQEIYAENCVFTIRSNCIPSSAEQTQDCYSHPILVFGETNLLMEDDEEEEYGENYNMAILTFDKKIQDEKNEILTGKITLLEELEMRKLVNILASHAFVDDEEGTNFRAQFPSLFDVRKFDDAHPETWCTEFTHLLSHCNWLRDLVSMNSLNALLERFIQPRSHPIVPSIKSEQDALSLIDWDAKLDKLEIIYQKQEFENTQVRNMHGYVIGVLGKEYLVSNGVVFVPYEESHVFEKAPIPSPDLLNRIPTYFDTIDQLIMTPIRNGQKIEDLQISKIST